jgi:hypothetical protein
MIRGASRAAIRKWQPAAANAYLRPDGSTAFLLHPRFSTRSIPSSFSRSCIISLDCSLDPPAV